MIRVRDKFTTAQKGCGIFPANKDFLKSYISPEILSELRIVNNPLAKKTINLTELTWKVNKTVINIYEPKDYYATERAMITLNAYQNQMGRKYDPKYEPMRAEYDLIARCKIEENAMLEERLRTKFYDTEVLADFRAQASGPPFVCRCCNCMKIEYIIRKRKIEKAKETIDRNTQYLKHYNIEDEESELDIAFCCESCDKQIVRDSEEHDHSSCDETGEIWYCQDCPVPEEDEYGEDDDKLDEIVANGDCPYGSDRCTKIGNLRFRPQHRLAECGGCKNVCEECENLIISINHSV